MRQRRPSNQTILVLQALLGRASDWRYGYDLTRQTGIKTGTLYPVLMRLADKGLLESAWHDSERQGAPMRHGYRLTAAGRAFAAEHVPDAAPQAGGHSPMPA